MTPLRTLTCLLPLALLATAQSPAPQIFGYRDFTAGADEILAELGMGRAHHRVLHFVGRRPGITVGDLLGILGITKQSLARVLTPLMEEP